MSSGSAPELSSGEFRPRASLDVLRFRARMMRRVRQFFDDRGFLEVETPLLSADTVIDLHLDPLAVTLFSDPRQPAEGRRMWLQTSPEFAMKRLLAAGLPSIYQITRAFRGGERGRLHNPEFTLVEWYGVGHDLNAGMRLLSVLADTLLERGAAEPIRYRDAFVAHASVDPHRASCAQLAAAAERSGVAVPPHQSRDDRDGWLDLLLVECVEPQLGRTRPAILYDYPPSQAALAQVRSGDPPVAERFELYVDGIELANGYHELLDAGELRRRNRKINQLRAAEGKYRLPEESRLLAAMESGLPPCAGVALGFDRLVMVACGVSDISRVVAFPIERA